jgi:hypothetical protein
MVSLFYVGMHTVRRVGAKAALIATVHPVGGRGLARRPPRPDERQTKAGRLALVLSLLLVLLAAALLIGGRAVIDPLLRAAAADREAHRLGEIVFNMPGTVCRHLSFDNKTAAITEGAVEPCAQDQPQANGAMGFAWGAR